MDEKAAESFSPCRIYEQVVLFGFQGIGLVVSAQFCGGGQVDAFERFEQGMALFERGPEIDNERYLFLSNSVGRWRGCGFNDEDIIPLFQIRVSDPAGVDIGNEAVDVIQKSDRDLSFPIIRQRPAVDRLKEKSIRGHSQASRYAPNVGQFQVHPFFPGQSPLADQPQNAVPGSFEDARFAIVGETPDFRLNAGHG